jgi:signal transduction histidine kinase
LDLDDRLERVKVCFDEGLLSHVIEDIIKNAVEASATRISIRTKLRPKSRSSIKAGHGNILRPEGAKIMKGIKLEIGTKEISDIPLHNLVN